MESQAQSKLVFTRYLYLKDEVKLALVTSLIEKNERSVFWAYELYYSGFQTELFDLLWKIYYDFYYTLNPAFQQYFIKKHKEWKTLESSSIEKDKIVAVIVQNLLIRPYNLDVFMLRQPTHSDKKEKKHKKKDLSVWFENKKYKEISDYILRQSDANDLDNTLNIMIDHFTKKNAKLDKNKIIKNIKSVIENTQISMRVLLISNMMLYYSIEAELVMGKKLYIIVDPNDVIMYETICINENLPSYKILSIACLYEIDEFNYLSLFKLERNNVNIHEKYWYGWMYHASLSPVWFERIQEYGGKINHLLQRVDFENEDLFEEFFQQFGYEPDEQKRETQDKNIKNIDNSRTWKSFYNTHKKNGLYNPSNNVTAIMEY